MTVIDRIFESLSYSPNVGANDIIGWCLAFIGGFIVFKIIDDFQTRISRHAMISEIEYLINKMFASDLAINENNKGKISLIFLRTILDDETRWVIYDKNCDKTKLIENQRYVKIRVRKNDNTVDYISTKAVHELMILFRRIEKLYKDGIIKKVDLADIWREILPFGVSGRPDFFSTYLLPSDIQSMKYVIALTLCSCQKYKNEDAIKYFKKYVGESLSIIELKNNKRYRLRDKLDIIRLRSIK